MLTAMVQLAIDFVGNEDHLVLLRHLGQRLQFVGSVGVAGRIRRIVEDDDAWTTRIITAGAVEIIRHQPPVVFWPGRHPVDLAPDDARLWRVRHPTRRGNDQIAVIDELQDKHQLLRAWADQHIVASALDTVHATVIPCHRIA